MNRRACVVLHVIRWDEGAGVRERPLSADRDGWYGRGKGPSAPSALSRVPTRTPSRFGTRSLGPRDLVDGLGGVGFACRGGAVVLACVPAQRGEGLHFSWLAFLRSGGAGNDARGPLSECCCQAGVGLARGGVGFAARWVVDKVLPPQLTSTTAKMIPH